MLAAFTVLDVSILLLTGKPSHRLHLLDRIVAASAAAPAAPSSATVAARTSSATRRSVGEDAAAPQGVGVPVQRPATTAARTKAPVAAPKARTSSRAHAGPARPTKHAAPSKSHAKARPKAAKKPAPLVVPAAGATSRSHYLRSLTGGSQDVARMRWLGWVDARAHGSGATRLVLLDIGGQLPRGVKLSASSKVIHYDALTRALRAYVSGYHDGQGHNAPVTIAIGTSNDLWTNAAAGRVWGERVVGSVARAARGFAGITIAGAIDIEPSFAAGPRETFAWVNGFLAATSASLIFNGSADGCSTTAVKSRCAHGWTAAALASLAGAWTSRITALPQIYNPAMASQWALISMTGVRYGGRPLRFWGPLTENAACIGQPDCPTMRTALARWLLWNALRTFHVPGRRVPVLASDLDVS